ncbi:curli assembly protein CsgF [Hyphomonas sp.]|uniref:curli assembly protein CsgF n=1 Tax=Hyphomonas sp. TaxID=87 RepID=UPI00391B4D35
MVGSIKSARAILAAAIFASVSAPALAQQLVYAPINPSFGGDSFNSSHLLAIANAQNTYRDPNAPSVSNSQMDQFLRQLQSRLLSSLAAQVNDAIFGPNPQESGTITFGDQIITFVRGLDSVTLTIKDLSTGTVTEVIIPLMGGKVDPSGGSDLFGMAGYTQPAPAGSTSLLSGETLAQPPALSTLGSSFNELGDLTNGGF